MNMEEDSQPPSTYQSTGAKNLCFFSLKKPPEQISVSVALDHNCGRSNVLSYFHDKKKKTSCYCLRNKSSIDLKYILLREWFGGSAIKSTFHRTQVQFQEALLGGSQQPLTPAPGHLVITSGTCIHMVYTHTDTHKQNNKIF